MVREKGKWLLVCGLVLFLAAGTVGMAAWLKPKSQMGPMDFWQFSPASYQALAHQPEFPLADEAKRRAYKQPPNLAEPLQLISEGWATYLGQSKLVSVSGAPHPMGVATSDIVAVSNPPECVDVTQVPAGTGYCRRQPPAKGDSPSVTGLLLVPVALPQALQQVSEQYGSYVHQDFRTAVEWQTAELFAAYAYARFHLPRELGDVWPQAANDTFVWCLAGVGLRALGSSPHRIVLNRALAEIDELEPQFRPVDSVLTDTTVRSWLVWRAYGHGRAERCLPGQDYR